MGYIEPDRRRPDARNLKGDKRRERAGRNGMTMKRRKTKKKNKEDTCKVRLPRFRGSKVDLFGGKSSLFA